MQPVSTGSRKDSGYIGLGCAHDYVGNLAFCRPLPGLQFTHGWFFNLATPLTDLLKVVKMNCQKISITAKALEAFHALQTVASSAPVLKLASWDEPFEADVSNLAIGAIRGASGRCKLNAIEKNYSVYKELLGVITSLKYWKPFLYGRDLIVKSYHKALTWLPTQVE